VLFSRRWRFRRGHQQKEKTRENVDDADRVKGQVEAPVVTNVRSDYERSEERAKSTACSNCGRRSESNGLLLLVSGLPLRGVARRALSCYSLRCVVDLHVGRNFVAPDPGECSL
jgi:hypothetical protein